MTPAQVLSLFSPLDAVAVCLLGAAWVGTTLWIENGRARRVSVSILMEGYRREWLQAYVTRTPRVFDMIALSNLRQGTAFFASSCLIGLGGGLALIANPETIASLAADLAIEQAPVLVWEIKTLLLLLLMANALFKFIWAHRLFGYCAVVMSAAPNDEGVLAYHHAQQAAEIANSAARSFNRGLRAVYFAVGAAAWLAGPWVLMASTILTVAVLWRREFNSKSREILLRKPPQGASE
ncbi:MAG: DUF599 domain-containing protein [Pseudomonadota bacterium]